MEMAQAGYRTLCIAQRELPESLFRTWHEQWQTACSAMRDREVQMARVAERMETQLDLLGATAVEDKLQVWGGVESGVRGQGWGVGSAA